ncbi:MAG: FHA domain-containing protein [Candidatus Brocadiia bacterium]
MRLRFTVVSSALNGQQVDLDADGSIQIGRTRDNDLVLDHKSVSRRHARLEANGQALHLVDLKSHNGTLVNDKLISECEVSPGDVLTFGQVQVKLEPVTAGQGVEDTVRIEREAADGETPPAGLPAIVQPGGAEVARPLSVDDLFQGPPPAEAPEETPSARRLRSSLLYSLLLVSVVVLGALALWAVGRKPAGPETIEVKLRAGETLPVNVGPRRGPDGRPVPGLYRVENIREPENQRVAYARKTKFTTFVTVHGRAVGTTDITLEGPPLDQLVLRVLVRGVKPESDAWEDALPEERYRRAKDLIGRALEMTHEGPPTARTTTAIGWLEEAAGLLRRVEGAEGDRAKALAASDRLRQKREEYFDRLAHEVETFFRDGHYKKCLERMEELKRIFHDPEEVEYEVVRVYDGVLRRKIRRELQAREER